MALTAEQLARLRRDQEDVQRRLLSGTRKYLYLWGKNATVKPGEVLVGRLGPRWDYKQQFIIQGGKAVPNPEYDQSAKVVIYQPMVEHWFNDAANPGKRRRGLCRKMLGLQYRCPICEIREALAGGTAQEQKQAEDMEANELFYFNFIVRGQEFTEDGAVDWRILVAPATVFTAVIDLITGGKNTQFARGEIFDPMTGYDISITRPSTKGVSYKVDCAPTASRLYPKEDTRWTKPKHWSDYLHDLEEEAQVESFEALYQAFYGEQPDPSYYSGDPPDDSPEAAAAGGGEPTFTEGEGGAGDPTEPEPGAEFAEPDVAPEPGDGGEPPFADPAEPPPAPVSRPAQPRPPRPSAAAPPAAAAPKTSAPKAATKAAPPSRPAGAARRR